MFRVITANVNGIRSAARKGFFQWAISLNPDVICLQETKAQRVQLSDPIFHPEGYTSYYSEAEKKGYSGVAIFTKHKPIKITHQLGWDCADLEGRYVQVDLANLSIASLYLPSGSSGDHRQAHKYKFMDCYKPILDAQLKAAKPIIICGDWNIAHQPIDIKNWKQNLKSSGFLPEERAWLDGLLGQGWVDAFRVLNKEPEQYTWWSERTRAWDKNIGWRIDYQIASPSLRDAIRACSIYRGEKFSDHAPVIVDYDLDTI